MKTTMFNLWNLVNINIPMKWLLIISACLLVCSILLNVLFVNEKPVIKIQREIHYIQTTRHSQSKKSDSLVTSNISKYKVKKQQLETMTPNEIESTFVSEIKDTNELEIMKTCLEYKYQHEQDSANFEIIKTDRDSCNEQLDNIVSKSDALVKESQKNSQKNYLKGILHGSVITGGIFGLIKIGLFIL